MIKDLYARKGEIITNIELLQNELNVINQQINKELTDNQKRDKIEENK